MKLVTLFAAFATLAIAAHAQAKSIRLSEDAKLRVCELVESETERGLNIKVPVYEIDTCLNEADISAEEEYTPRDPQRYSIRLNTGELIPGSDLWLACEFSAVGKINAQTIGLDWCSIEQ